MDMQAVGLFVAAATALLGSPGPGIVALLAVGKAQGWTQGIRYYAGLQIGLAVAAVSSGAGLVTVLAVYPVVTRAMGVGATIYLVYLAYAIATSPVGTNSPDRPGSYSPVAGLLLGITNPKAYLAFASLLASPLRLMSSDSGNIALKVALCIAVIIVVDLAWLWFGVAMGRKQLTPLGERSMNIVMSGTILIATALALF
jgi:threonine/homoserine/homoserine lactone efflux protein